MHWRRGRETHTIGKVVSRSIDEKRHHFESFLTRLQSLPNLVRSFLQVENEYDGHGRDDGYMESLATALRESGFDVPLCTSEMTWALCPSQVPGLIRGVLPRSRSALRRASSDPALWALVPRRAFPVATRSG